MEKGKTILTRSLKYLISLEIRSQPSQQDSQMTNQRTAAQASSQLADMSCNRPRRKVAVIGEICRRDNC